MANTEKWARKAAKSAATDVRKGQQFTSPSLGPTTKTQKLLAAGPRFHEAKETSYISKAINKQRAKKDK